MILGHTKPCKFFNISIYLDTNISEKSSNTKMQNTAFMHSLYTVYESNGQKYLLNSLWKKHFQTKAENRFQEHMN